MTGRTADEIARHPAIAYVQAYDAFADAFSHYADIETPSSLERMKLGMVFLRDASIRDALTSPANLASLAVRLENWREDAELRRAVSRMGLTSALDVMLAAVALLLLRQHVDLDAVMAATANALTDRLAA